jgi:glycosyltransferase involved in cell wall biosynthesis
MAFAEALAHGLPIIACRAGAVPEVVPPEAGMLVPVDDPDALARALAALLNDRDTRRRMGEAAWQAGQTLPGWNDTARLVARALERAAR